MIQQGCKRCKIRGKCPHKQGIIPKLLTGKFWLRGPRAYGDEKLCMKEE